MATPLKVGLAGLGTVGASVVRLIGEQRTALTARCGRPIDIVAVTARSKAKNRGIDLKKIRWVSDPIALKRILLPKSYISDDDPYHFGLSQ